MWPMRTSVKELCKRLWLPKHGDELHDAILKPEDIAKFCFTDAQRFPAWFGRLVSIRQAMS
jgi:hypothetical protein